jgi:TonB family protein
MNFDDFYKRFVAFGLMFSLSLLAAAFFYDLNLTRLFRQKEKPVPKIVSTTTNNGIGDSGDDYGADDPRNFQDKTLKKSDSKPELTEGIKIISKPRAIYTDEARVNQVQGKVILRVTFSANGKIGAISIISGLPDGLTEQAINAAKGIKFEPAKRNGVPYSVTKPVEYTFTIY